MAMPTMPQFRLPLPTAPIESLSTLSPIIEQTRSFYHSRGADAFTSGSVPHHISTSAFLANEYATLIHRIHATSKSGGCAYVLDYGCGCGVLGIRVARELHRRHPTLPFCVLLADLDPSAAIAQAELPSAADLRKLGRLDVVKLDASAPLPPDGLQAFTERTLHPSEIHQEGDGPPLVVLASYLFDSLPIEVYRVVPSEYTGQKRPLDETIRIDALTMSQRKGRKGGQRIEFEYRTLSERAAAAAIAPGETRMERLRSRLIRAAADGATAGCAATLVPTGAAECIWSLHDWLCSASSAGSDPSLVLLIGDKIVETESLTTHAAAKREDNKPFPLSELKLLDAHGGASTGALLVVSRPRWHL